MFPLFSILRQEANFQMPPALFLLLHLKRVHLMEWVRAVMATTLGATASRGLPPILLQQETPHIALQTSAHDLRRHFFASFIPCPLLGLRLCIPVFVPAPTAWEMEFSPFWTCICMFVQMCWEALHVGTNGTG